MSAASTPSLWRHGSFVAFWWSRTASIIAFQMLSVALAWQVYEITGKAWDLGLVGLMQFLPMLLFTLPAGQVADHYNRQKIAFYAQMFYSVLLLVLAVASYQRVLGRDGLLLAAFVVGAVRAFEFPAASALLPALVPSSLLVSALSVTSSARQAAFIIGPALGGACYAWGAAPTYLLAMILFVLATISIAKVNYQPPKTTISKAADLATMLAGIRYIWTNKVLLGAISLDLFAVLLGGATALLPIYAREILLTDAFGLGVLRAAPAVGALVMSLYAARYPVERQVGPIMFGSVAVFGVATMIFAVSTNLILSLAALVVLGAADMFSVVVRSALVQLETPDDMRGRVGAVNWLFIGTSNQLGEFESGATAAWWGVVPSAVAGGCGTLAVVALWWHWFPQLAKRDRLVLNN